MVLGTLGAGLGLLIFGDCAAADQCPRARAKLSPSARTTPAGRARTCSTSLINANQATPGAAQTPSSIDVRAAAVDDGSTFHDWLRANGTADLQDHPIHFLHFDAVHRPALQIARRIEGGAFMMILQVV
jgi:hypothetical protein